MSQRTATLRIHLVSAEDQGRVESAELELRPHEEIIDIESGLVGGYASFQVTTMEISAPGKLQRR